MYLLKELLEKVNKQQVIFSVHIPAYVFNGRDYHYDVAKIRVLASSKEEAVSIVNSNKQDVIRFLTSQKIAPSFKKLIAPKMQVKDAIIFKNDYFAKQTNIVHSKSVMTSHGGFKTVHLTSQLSESIDVRLLTATDYAFTLLKNSREAFGNQTDDPAQIDSTTMQFGIRDFGNWEVPEDEEDDGDYDWEVPTEGTIAKLKAYLETAKKHHPFIEYDFQIGEKSWIYVSIKLVD